MRTTQQLHLLLLIILDNLYKSIVVARARIRAICHTRLQANQDLNHNSLEAETMPLRRITCGNEELATKEIKVHLYFDLLFSVNITFITPDGIKH